MKDLIIKTVYVYSRNYDGTTSSWNPDNINRLSSQNKKVLLSQEIYKTFPEKKFITYCGYNNIANEIGIVFHGEPLTPEEVDTLSTVVYNHKNNVPDKYAVWFQDSFVQDPGNPGNAYLFDTEELAQQFIINDNLEGAIVKGVVVLWF